MIGLEGLTAGAAHVLTGPDHMAGVAPLAADGGTALEPPSGAAPAERAPGWLVGLTWGVGHGAGVAALGLLGRIALEASDVELASVWAERLVGVLLIWLGLSALLRSRRLAAHARRALPPSAATAPVGPERPRRRRRRRHAALGVGALHGLAGGSHFWAVLPSLAMEREEAALYIAAYVASSAAVMALFGAALARIGARLGTAWMPGFLGGVGAVTALVGAWWIAAAP